MWGSECGVQLRRDGFFPGGLAEGVWGPLSEEDSRNSLESCLDCWFGPGEQRAERVLGVGTVLSCPLPRPRTEDSAGRVKDG